MKFDIDWCWARRRTTSWRGQRKKPTCIVIGTHGRTGLMRVLMGSVAESIMRLAKCPVLTVKQANHVPE